MAYDMEDEEDMTDEAVIEHLSHALTEGEVTIVIDALRHYRSTIPALGRCSLGLGIERLVHLFAESV
jgi:hypothetical protein